MREFYLSLLLLFWGNFVEGEDYPIQTCIQEGDDYVRFACTNTHVLKTFSSSNDCTDPTALHSYPINACTAGSEYSCSNTLVIINDTDCSGDPAKEYRPSGACASSEYPNEVTCSGSSLTLSIYSDSSCTSPSNFTLSLSSPACMNNTQYTCTDFQIISGTWVHSVPDHASCVTTTTTTEPPAIPDDIASELMYVVVYTTDNEAAATPRQADVRTAIMTAFDLSTLENGDVHLLSVFDGKNLIRFEFTGIKTEIETEIEALSSVQRIAKLSDEITALSFGYHVVEVDGTRDSSSTSDDYLQMAKDNYLYLAAGAIAVALLCSFGYCMCRNKKDKKQRQPTVTYYDQEQENVVRYLDESGGEPNPKVSIQDEPRYYDRQRQVSNASVPGAKPPVMNQSYISNTSQQPNFPSAPASPVHAAIPVERPSMDFVDYQHSYNKGDRVEIWSQSNGRWVPADVMELQGIDKIIVQYMSNDITFKKKIRATDVNKVRPTNSIKNFAGVRNHE